MPTVSVGCKLPHGLHMDIKGKGRVTLHGFALPVGQDQRLPDFTPPLIVGGYAITPDVDEEFVRAWMEEHKTSDVVQKKLIFIQAKAIDARAQAKDQSSLLSGLEPINPDNPGRGLERVVT